MVAPLLRRSVLARAAGVVAVCVSNFNCLADVSASMSLEPLAAQQLYELLQGRRPSGWKDEERAMIDKLVDELVALRRPWRSADARGKFRIAYLQEGREAPLRPSLNWVPITNENYRIYSRSDVISIAELLGPLIEVRAAGAWRDDAPASAATPKRFREDLSQGAICGAVTMGRVEKANIGRACAPLPLSPRSETYRVVEGLYLDPRIRIDQDINSGGRRLVQVRVQSFSGR